MWYKLSTRFDKPNELDFTNLINPEYHNDENKKQILSKLIENYDYYKPNEPIPAIYHPSGALIKEDKSMWILKDGSIIDIDASHHVNAYQYVKEMFELNHIDESFNDNKYNSFELYDSFGEVYGAIRLYLSKYSGGTVVRITSIPTPAQIEKLREFSPFKIGEIAAGWYPNRVYGSFTDIYDLEDILENHANAQKRSEEESKEATQPTNPNIQQSFVDTQIAPDLTNTKALENKQLYKNFPGKENEKIRSLYEKSASFNLKISQSLPPIHDRCKCYIETFPGGRKTWQFADNCCELCKGLAFEFNQTQSSIFDNEPAKIPSQPTPIIKSTPEATPEDQITNEYLYPKRLFNHFRF